MAVIRCQKAWGGMAVSVGAAGFMHKLGHLPAGRFIFNIAENITNHLCNFTVDIFRIPRKNCLQFSGRYDILLKYFGGVAHLGERLNGIQEVRGSIPLISTKSRR